jgi:hypothetical protein
MILPEVAMAACLMLNVSPSVAKKCEEIVEKRCFEEKKHKSYKTCFEAIAPEINVLMKKQYAKACTLG